MYGLEKKPKKEKFQFDLEEELHKNPKKKEKLLQQVKHKVEEMKKIIRKGGSSKELEKYGVLFHAYGALHKVVQKIEKP